MANSPMKMPHLISSLGHARRATHNPTSARHAGRLREQDAHRRAGRALGALAHFRHQRKLAATLKVPCVCEADPQQQTLQALRLP